MRELRSKKNLVNIWRGLEKKAADLLEMIVLAIGEEDYSLKEEIQLELKKLSSRFEQLESQQLFLAITIVEMPCLPFMLVLVAQSLRIGQTCCSGCT
jgi:protein subunit release factor A